MANADEILEQIRALTEELARTVEQERKSGDAEARSRLEALSAELAELRAERDEAQAARRKADQELEVAEKRIDTLVHKLKDARQAAADAAEEAQRALRRQLEALQAECDEARAELEQERSVRKRLEKGAAADEKRLAELEKAVAVPVPAAAGAPGAARDAAALEEARETARGEKRLREAAEAELDEAHKLIASLEKALKEARPVAAAREAPPAAEQLRTAEARIEELRREGESQAVALAGARQRLAELEAAAAREGAPRSKPAAAAESGTVVRTAPDKPLPHELRPAPRPGALFRPDWDLAGLPCKSPDQVLQAWESVSNVQLMLEGYPSQYCSAFLVVLKQGRGRHLYLLFNLRESRHTLVCVPGKPPTDEDALAKAVEEGLKYLKMSGFELNRIKPADVAHILGSYFLG